MSESDAPVSQGHAAVLVARQVSVSFGGLKALEGVDLQARRGEVTGLIGPNGAGKSTLFAVISGHLRPSSGRVELNGVDVTRLGVAGRARLGLGRTFQQPSLFQDLTVRQHMALAFRMRHARKRLWADALAAGALRRESTKERQFVDSLLDSLGLTAVASRPPVGLPLGTMRLVEVGRALATEPDVVMLDEPASGLRADERERLHAVISTLRRSGSAAVVLVEHDLDLVLGLSDVVTVLDFGAVIASGPAEAVRHDPAVRIAYLGDLEEADVK